MSGVGEWNILLDEMRDIPLQFCGLQLVWRKCNNNTGIEQPWPQLMYCTLVSCHVYGHLFQSSGTLSKKEVNSGVRSYIAENVTRIWRK